jgi:hypothetical protein
MASSPSYQVTRTPVKTPADRRVSPGREVA